MSSSSMTCRPVTARPRRPRRTLTVGSYGDGAFTEDLLRRAGIDAILHCAARSLVGESVQDPARYYRDNVAGGVALLEAARAAGVGRIVFSSTAAVYGVPDATPIPEDAPLRPINTYGETKRTFEAALRWYGGAYGLRSVVLALLQRRRRDGAPGRDPSPGDAPHPERAHGGRRRATADAVRRRLPDARRDADPRLHPRLRPGGCAPPRAGADGFGTRGRRPARSARSATSAAATGSRYGMSSAPRSASRAGRSRTASVRDEPATRPCSSPRTGGRRTPSAGARNAPRSTR